MYRALVRSQWATTGPILIVAVLLGFVAPLAQMSIGALIHSGGDPGDSAGILASQMEVAPLYPLLAWFCGLLLAASTWQADAQGKHIYALILPVPRWYYLLLRLSAGLTYLLAPAMAVGIAALIATSQVTLPPGLHAYPGGLVIRFALASALSFTILFAIGSANERTIRRGAIAFIVLLMIAIALTSAGFDAGPEAAIKALFRWPSFVDGFAGRWLLFDV